MDDLTEIERRFLVDGRGEKPWREGSQSHRIEQHYHVGKLLELRDQKLYLGARCVAQLTSQEWGIMQTTTSWTTRLRQRNGSYILTYKSKVSHDTALELEWLVDPTLATAILDCGPFPSVQKTRYVLEGDDGLVWEVDEFEGALAGLILAEVELEASDESVDIPPWAGQEITGLPSWSNRALAETLSNRTR